MEISPPLLSVEMTGMKRFVEMTGVLRFVEMMGCSLTILSFKIFQGK